MTKTSKPILFFGTEDFSARFLEALLDDGYDIRAVITKPDSKKGRGHKLSEPLVKSIASQRGITVWQPLDLREITSDIETFGDVAAVLVSYGKIIPQSIIDLFHPGIINVHPSLLPRYRGPSPIESAILHGDEKTGVSIMQLTSRMDAGPIYSQVEVTLHRNETKPSLYKTLAETGVVELRTVLPRILDGSLTPVPQDESEATYCPLLSKSNSLLEPSELTAREAERHVRAFLGFPKSRFVLQDQSIVITKTHVSPIKKTPLDVMFSDGQFLSIDELIAPSGRTMGADAFLRGYQF